MLALLVEHCAVFVFRGEKRQCDIKSFTAIYEGAAFLVEYCASLFCNHGVATVSRIDKIIGFLCRILSILQGSFAKKTYNLSILLSKATLYGKTKQRTVVSYTEIYEGATFPMEMTTAAQSVYDKSDPGMSHVVVCCSVLQFVAVCCSLLYCVVVFPMELMTAAHSMCDKSDHGMSYAAVCCSVLQCVAVCCSVLQCVANTLQCSPWN